MDSPEANGAAHLEVLKVHTVNIMLPAAKLAATWRHGSSPTEPARQALREEPRTVLASATGDGYHGRLTGVGSLIPISARAPARAAWASPFSPGAGASLGSRPRAPGAEPF